MFTVWESIKQSFKTVFLLGVVTWSIHWGSVRPQSLRRGCFIPSTPPHPAHYPLSRCECHVVLSLGTFACVAVSGGEVCLFCVTEIKKQPPPLHMCFLLCYLVISTHFHIIGPFSVWWSCMQSVPRDTWQHEPHSANSVSYVFPTATSPQLLKKKKEKKLPNNRRFNPEMQGIGICTGFYSHSILRLHFCHRRIL